MQYQRLVVEIGTDQSTMQKTVTWLVATAYGSPRLLQTTTKKQLTLHHCMLLSASILSRPRYLSLSARTEPNSPTLKPIAHETTQPCPIFSLFTIQHSYQTQAISLYHAPSFIHLLILAPYKLCVCLMKMWEFRPRFPCWPLGLLSINQ